MAIDEARETLASALQCLPGEIVFTSSGTEAANLALLGCAWQNRHGNRRRILIGAAEHHCVLQTATLLCEMGYIVETIPASAGAWIDPAALMELISDDVLIVTAMHANNETGAINDAARMLEICTPAGALYFCDAVQSFALIETPPADYIAVSAHKIYGPKGAGALRARAGAKLQAQIVGGGQERELRAGTENVAAIVGFAKAVELAREDTDRAERIRAVRDAFVTCARSELREFSPVFAALDIAPDAVLPTHAHLRIPGASAEAVLINLDREGVAASSGAACSSGSIEPSHVLLASGLAEKQAAEGLRFSFGKDTSIEDAKIAARKLHSAAAQVLR